MVNVHQFAQTGLIDRPPERNELQERHSETSTLLVEERGRASSEPRLSLYMELLCRGSFCEDEKTKKEKMK